MHLALERHGRGAIFRRNESELEMLANKFASQAVKRYLAVRDAVQLEILEPGKHQPVADVHAELIATSAP